MADLNEYRVYIKFLFEPEKNAAESFVILKVTLGSIVFVQVLRHVLCLGVNFWLKTKRLSTPLLLPRFKAEWLVSFPQMKMPFNIKIFNYIAKTEAKSCDYLRNFGQCTVVYFFVAWRDPWPRSMKSQRDPLEGVHCLQGNCWIISFTNFNAQFFIH